MAHESIGECFNFLGAADLWRRDLEPLLSIPPIREEELPYIIQTQIPQLLLGGTPFRIRTSAVSHYFG